MAFQSKFTVLLIALFCTSLLSTVYGLQCRICHDRTEEKKPDQCFRTVKDEKFQKKLEMMTDPVSGMEFTLVPADNAALCINLTIIEEFPQSLENIRTVRLGINQEAIIFPELTYTNENVTIKVGGCGSFHDMNNNKKLVVCGCDRNYCNGQKGHHAQPLTFTLIVVGIGLVVRGFQISA